MTPTFAPKKMATGPDGGAIAGIVIGVLAAVVILGGGGYYYYIQKQKDQAGMLLKEEPEGYDTEL
jgi:hypothetical protein